MYARLAVAMLFGFSPLMLAQAAELVASPQIRNQGTLGGNVSQDARCWYYRAGWPCYRAGGNICYADTPVGRNREPRCLVQDSPRGFEIAVWATEHHQGPVGTKERNWFLHDAFARLP